MLEHVQCTLTHLLGLTIIASCHRTMQPLSFLHVQLYNHQQQDLSDVYKKETAC